ncbi:MAG: S8 family serine peptidase [Acidimicrobiales bacterium]
MRSKPALIAVAVLTALTAVTTFDSVENATYGESLDGIPVAVLVDSNGAAPGGLELETVMVDSKRDAQKMIDRVEDQPGVIGASTPKKVSMMEVTGALASNDQHRPSQWSLNRLNIEQAWRISRGAGVIVAVIDTGVMTNHPDLAGRIARSNGAVLGANFVGWQGAHPGSSIPLDGSPVGPMSTSEGAFGDGQGHGTHVAGIVAAAADNVEGGAGVAPDAMIMPVKVLGDDGSGDTRDVAAGIVWAVQNGAQIINLSLGGTGEDVAMTGAIQYAVNHGVSVFAAAGNCGSGGGGCPGVSPPLYPAASLPSTGAMAVAATGSSDERASFSNEGAYVDIAAPGTSILSTCNPSSAIGSLTGSALYCWLQGTSMSTPAVAGVAALLKSQAPSRSATDITSLLAQSATDIGVPGHDTSFGAGLVNPVAALSVGFTVTVPNPPLITGAQLDVGRIAIEFVSTGDGGSPITNYIVAAEPGGILVLGSGPSIWVEGLISGVMYTFRVAAFNAVGPGGPSGVSVPLITLPPGPVQLHGDEVWIDFDESVAKKKVTVQALVEVRRGKRVRHVWRAVASARLDAAGNGGAGLKFGIDSGTEVRTLVGRRVIDQFVRP